MRVKNVRLWVAVGIVAAVLGIFFWQNSRREERNYRIIFIPKIGLFRVKKLLENLMEYGVI